MWGVSFSEREEASCAFGPRREERGPEGVPALLKCSSGHDTRPTCARTTADCLSCIAFSTTNLARSASCCATCLASTAAVYSLLKVSCGGGWW